MPAALRKYDPATLLFAALALIVAITIMYAGRGFSFYFDEWNIIIDRRGMSADSLLSAHEGHLTLIPVLVYKVLLQAIGIDHYWVYRLLVVVLHLTAAGLVFVLARRRVSAEAAFFVAGFVLILGAAWANLLWAFQIGFIGAVAASLGALVLLDDDKRRSDVGASGLLLVALGCASPAISFVAVVATELAFRKQWGRLVRVLAVPVVLYGIWRLGWGGSGELHKANFDDIPAYAFQMIQFALQGAFGLSQTSAGPAIAVLGIALSLVFFVKRPLTPRLAGLLVGAAVLFALTCLARAQEGDPGASRYIYTTVVFLVLIAAEMLQSELPEKLSRRALAVAGVVFAIAALGNVQSLLGGRSTYGSAEAMVQTELAALTIAREHAPLDLPLDPKLSPQVVAGPYFRAADAFGTTVLTPAQIAARPFPERMSADSVLLRSEFKGLTPVTGALKGCRDVAPGTPFPLPTEGVVLQIPAEQTGKVHMRRFGGDFQDPVADPSFAGGTPVKLMMPADAAPEFPWTVQVSDAAELRVCDVP